MALGTFHKIKYIFPLRYALKILGIKPVIQSVNSIFTYITFGKKCSSDVLHMNNCY